MLRTGHGIDTIGIISYVILRIREYETATGIKPTRIKLGENRVTMFAEEIELLRRAAETHDLAIVHVTIDNIAGIPIVRAEHPNDIIIDSTG
jgi:hypothetical protein